jgi:hypothetical protein
MSHVPTRIDGDVMPTVEEKIALRASRKLLAERTVLAKGKFSMVATDEVSTG